MRERVWRWVWLWLSVCVCVCVASSMECRWYGRIATQISWSIFFQLEIILSKWFDYFARTIFQDGDWTNVRIHPPNEQTHTQKTHRVWVNRLNPTNNGTIVDITMNVTNTCETRAQLLATFLRYCFWFDFTLLSFDRRTNLLHFNEYHFSSFSFSFALDFVV